MKCPVRAKLKCPNNPSEDEVREAEIGFGDDDRIAELERLRAGLTRCIGCGCLSLQECRLAKDRLLELHAQSSGLTANMGDRLTAASQAEVEFAVHTKHVEGATRVFLEDGKPFSDSGDAKVQGSDETTRLRWISDGKRHWFRSDVRGPDGKLWLMGNPVYVNWRSSDNRATKQ